MACESLRNVSAEFRRKPETGASASSIARRGYVTTTGKPPAAHNAGDHFPPHSDSLSCGHSLGNRGDCGGISLPVRRESGAEVMLSAPAVFLNLPAAAQGHPRKAANSFIPAPVLAEPQRNVAKPGKSGGEARESTNPNGANQCDGRKPGTLAAGITF